MFRALFLIPALLLMASPVVAKSLTGEVSWQGKVEFSESVRVEPGATLTVEPGARIVFTNGGLEVAGTLVAQDCRFEGDDWKGISLKSNSAATQLQNVTISGAKTGIFIGGGSPVLEKVTVRGNDIGIELKQKSRATLKDCRFEGNRKVGLFIKDDSTPTVTGGTFVDSGRYGAYLHRSKPASFSGHVFERNKVGLAVSHVGSNPLITDSVFRDNPLGVLVDRAALPELRGNRWEKNEVGLKVHRRSDPLVSGNQFEGNELAVLVSFSSYPRIERNAFESNGMALKLEFQSATWEKQRGEKARAAEVARQGAFGGQDSTQVDTSRRRVSELTDRVDARNNWWGVAGTHELQKVEGACNPSFIDDGRDRPQFEEEGEMYPLDKVDFAPWLEASPVGGDA
jgi:nitrous oxidase accessory protein NosD